MFIRSYCVVPIVGMIALSGLPAIAGDPKPAVSLFLTKASAEQMNQDVLFRCEVMLGNATGKELTVRSNFFSAFDGLELVVTSLEGTSLAHQGYTFHQSPFTAAGRDFPIKKGNAKDSLVFPVGDLPAPAKMLKIRLEPVIDFGIPPA